MKKYYNKWPLLALVIGLHCSFVNKNANKSVYSVAYYHFQHIKDTTQSGKVSTEEFYLAFNETQSLYISKTKLDRDSLQQLILKKANENNSDIVDMGMFVPATDESILNTNAGLNIFNHFNGNNYLIQEPIEKINWEITDETTQILGYTCQKAVGMYKGRNYSAWFTIDIPAAFGPWKLQGLPGLILEAYDNSGRIKFSCTKLIRSQQLPGSISFSIADDAIPTTQKRYAQMKKAQADGFGIDAFVSEVTIKQVSNGGAPQSMGQQKKFTINYPLELTP